MLQKLNIYRFCLGLFQDWEKTPKELVQKNASDKSPIKFLKL